MSSNTVGGAGRAVPGIAVQVETNLPVGIAFTERAGGHSQGRWGALDGAGGLNLGDHVGDDAGAVASNRARVEAAIGRPVRWLSQVHGIVVDDADADADVPGLPGSPVAADAQITTRSDIALGILVADCMPVLLADRGGRIVGAAHAGWRGLVGGILEATAAAMRTRCPAASLTAWLGPCIGPAAFEVGDEVRAAFVAVDPACSVDFRPGAVPGKWWADLPALARRRLAAAGVAISGDQMPACTVSDPVRYWSFRRDRVCGRMAGLIWRTGAALAPTSAR